jgi:hypothetical protein
MISITFREIGGGAYVTQGKRSYTLIKQTNQVWRISSITTVEKVQSRTVEKVRMSICSQEKMGVPTVRVVYPSK